MKAEHMAFCLLKVTPEARGLGLFHPCIPMHLTYHRCNTQLCSEKHNSIRWCCGRNSELAVKTPGFSLEVV